MMPIRSGLLNAVVLFELEAWLDSMKMFNEKQYGKQRILDLRNRILSTCVTDDRCDGIEVVREPCLVWTPPEGCSIFWVYSEMCERGGRL